ncbi:MAG TPA: site-2 protease family protein [Thermoplasmata archaeon]|nr:site-2 protease family protein [Thermoplasmata archaeon]
MAGRPIPNPPTPPPEIERIRADVATYFPVYETRLTANSLILLVHADPATLEVNFDRLRRDLWAKFYVPQIRLEHAEYLIEVVRRPNRRPWGFTVNLALLATTVITTVAAGAFLWVAYQGGSALRASDFLWGGLTFALPLLTILGLHELAHFLTARRHHVEASLPFFIPVPPPYLLFGTFGAFISLREPIPDKKALLDIGASGPLAGFAVAIPVTLYGMMLSAHAPALSVANCGPAFLGVNYGNFLFGTSLLWEALGLFVPVSFVNLSPVALAGWVGILVTAINLLPAGQLDGGHVFRALFGDGSRYVSYAATILLFGLGFLYSGWFIFAVLILLLGLRHPPPLNDITRLDAKRWAVGALACVVLVGGFVLVPIATPTGDFALENASSSSGSVPISTSLSANLSLTIANHDLVPHGYLFNASVVKVVRATNNSSAPHPLQGAELASYLANSTWVVRAPNGNLSTFTGSGSFAIPSTDYTMLNASGLGTLNVTYQNPQPAEVTILLTVAELCSSGLAGPQDQIFTIY